ncbi:MAG: hypothetical protein M5U28_10480 [Sandaracinaceae bacterium]|nr:hypothetical protein [Sandaracinaceae bacterium]
MDLGAQRSRAAGDLTVGVIAALTAVGRVLYDGPAHRRFEDGLSSVRLRHLPRGNTWRLNQSRRRPSRGNLKYVVIGVVLIVAAAAVWVAHGRVRRGSPAADRATPEQVLPSTVAASWPTKIC